MRHGFLSSLALILLSMPAGLHRYQQGGGLHFITFSCYHRLKHLDTPAARCLFENALETVRERYRLAVLAYVVMPEHVHLLVSEPARGDLSKAIQALKLSVAVRSTERPFWQARYFDGNIHEERATTDVIRSIHRNPVVRGLAQKPEDWPWSSFRHYATGEQGSVEIESFWMAWRRGNETLVRVRRSAVPAAASPGSQNRGPGAPEDPS